MKTSNSLHIQWPLTSQLHGSFLKENNWFLITDQTPNPYLTRSLSAREQWFEWDMDYLHSPTHISEFVLYCMNFFTTHISEFVLYCMNLPYNKTRIDPIFVCHAIRQLPNMSDCVH
jgi:hypothetical protein